MKIVGYKIYRDGSLVIEFPKGKATEALEVFNFLNKYYHDDLIDLIRVQIQEQEVCVLDNDWMISYYDTHAASILRNDNE